MGYHGKLWESKDLGGKQWFPKGLRFQISRASSVAQVEMFIVCSISIQPLQGQRAGNCARRSISRVLCLAPKSKRRPFLWDARCRTPHATDPDDSSKTSLCAANRVRGARVAPIWSCSEWGLPCRSRYRDRGALLPHRFTLARPREGTSAVSSLLHFPWVRTRRALPGTLVSVEPGLSSNDLATARGRPTVWRAAM